MKICIVLSTRPEIIKLAPIIKILKSKKEKFFLVNTNQHYINIMSKVFFDYFNIPKPKYNINAPTKTHGAFFSKTINAIEKILFKEKPDYLIVQGDTNTALAGSLAGSIFNRRFLDSNQKIKIVHVESGLRSFDEKMPEEINRKLVDALSNILFPPTDFDLKNLKNERLSNKKIYKVGNTISDVIKAYLPKIRKNKILKKLNLNKKKYFLVTLHRPECVDNIANFKKLLNTFERIGKIFNTKFIFSVHPRTQNILNKMNRKNFKYISLLKPLEYLDFMKLMIDSRIIFTDSGGLQEEASIIGVPCITLRTTTERQITLIKKTNIITGYNQKKILDATKKFYNKKMKKNNFFGNGNVSKKIYNKLKANFKKN
jgi:UDP-N-acetylglucosamine 2-epimerase (non-hydrolysing)